MKADTISLTHADTHAKNTFLINHALEKEIYVCFSWTYFIKIGFRTLWKLDQYFTMKKQVKIGTSFLFMLLLTFDFLKIADTIYVNIKSSTKFHYDFCIRYLHNIFFEKFNFYFYCFCSLACFSFCFIGTHKALQLK